MTPRMRTVTFGFFCSMMLSGRALVGHWTVSACEWPRKSSLVTPQHRQLHVLDRAVVVVEEIEPAHLVRAIVRAIARADAAIVGHDVEALFICRGGVDRADRLARCVLALLAGHRLEEHLRIVEVIRIERLGPGVERVLRRIVVGEVSVDADPVHLAAADDLELADDGNVVFPPGTR